MRTAVGGRGVGAHALAQLMLSMGRTQAGRLEEHGLGHVCVNACARVTMYASECVEQAFERASYSPTHIEHGLAQAGRLEEHEAQQPCQCAPAARSAHGCVLRQVRRQVLGLGVR